MATPATNQTVHSSPNVHGFFAVVICFRVAASARAVSSVTVSSRAGWLHTVLLYDATAQFNVLFHLSMWSAYLRGSTFGHIFTQSVVLFKWSVPYFRSDGNQSFTSPVFKSDSNTIPVVSAYKQYLPYRWSQKNFLYSVVLSRRHNCISLLFFKSWQVVTYSTTLLLPKLANLIFTLFHSSTMHITKHLVCRLRETVILLFVVFMFCGYHNIRPAPFRYRLNCHRRL